ncbi:hypothetical protein F511_28134 [Dorcoceras hygrometricum]|uniref:Uncharacterized protein n=1 Tax=Dorcoceras hygrometricum TaxID=472368 RepID=A0A2Z7BM29_9LAMI|nr:hypothetical protein F511_28134 [Dorcoceras hygrometricum]
MSASGESSTTMHRLLHASGSHPIPTPYDPKTNQYNQDLGLIHSTNGNHLESPNEGSSIDHQKNPAQPSRHRRKIAGAAAAGGAATTKKFAAAGAQPAACFGRPSSHDSASMRRSWRVAAGRNGASVRNTSREAATRARRRRRASSASVAHRFCAHRLLHSQPVDHSPSIVARLRRAITREERRTAAQPSCQQARCGARPIRAAVRETTRTFPATMRGQRAWLSRGGGVAGISIPISSRF